MALQGIDTELQHLQRRDTVRITNRRDGRRQHLAKLVLDAGLKAKHAWQARTRIAEQFLTRAGATASQHRSPQRTRQRPRH